MPDLAPFASISHLFSEFTTSAWRLETRRGYATDRHGPNWARWKNGEDFTGEPFDTWRANVAAQCARGRTFRRIRLIDDPLTEGQQFLLARAPLNEAAGEDIRHLPRPTAAALDLPDGDFWLFDDRLVVRLVFDDDDTTLGVTCTEDPSDVAAACRARERAWPHAIRTNDLATQVRS